jgi:hypothetical protein
MPLSDYTMFIATTKFSLFFDFDDKGSAGKTPAERLFRCAVNLCSIKASSAD